MQRRIELQIAYDGTCYHGFQLQKAVPTIEGALNRALSNLLKEEIAVIGASRTDAGVHALGNIAVFDTCSSIPADRYPFALLRYLPDDIRVVRSREVPADFNPRTASSVKTYEYTYSCGPIEDPISRRFSTFSKFIPDISLMREGAFFLKGEHDFTSFSNPDSQIISLKGSAVRNVYSIDIDSIPGGAGKFIKIRVSGNGFLYNMVRIFAGTLMKVGLGHWTPEKVGEILKLHERRYAGPTAQARGLKLVSIRFI